MIEIENRRLIRKALRLALRPDPGIDYGQPTWSTRVCNRLTTLAIYSVVDKSTVPLAAMTCLKCFSEGWGYDQIGDYVKLNPRTVQNKITEAMDFIIDHTPDNLLKEIPVIPRRCLYGACQKCRGTLMWESEDGEYRCINCGAPHNTKGEMTRWEI